MGSGLQSQLITIGVTCYNASDTIRRAVESALCQSWQNKEIVVVDDCSTDASWDVLQELSLNYPEIRIFRHSVNRGFPGALNTIISVAQGEFIALFDDDDQCHHDRIIKQFERLTTYESRQGAAIVLCYTNRNVILAGGDRVDHVARAIGREPPEPTGPMVADYLFGHLVDSTHCWGMLGSCTLMVRRSVLNNLNGFDEDFRRCAEWDLAIRAALEGAHFIAVNEPLITQYQTKTSDKAGKKPLTYALKLRYKHAHYLRQHGVYWGAIAIAHSRFAEALGRHWKSQFYRALALAVFPWRVTLKKFTKFVSM